MAATMFAGSAIAAKPAVSARSGRRALKVQAAAYNGAYAEELVATAVSKAWSSRRSTGRAFAQPATASPLPLHYILPRWSSPAPAEQDCQPRQGHPG